MSKFILNAEIRLASPTNIRQVAQQLKNTFKGVKVDIPVNADSRKVDQLNKSLNTTTKATGAASKGAKDFGDSIYLATKRYAAFVAGTAGIFKLINAFTFGVREALKFQHEMVRIGQVTNKSLISLKGVSDQIRSLSVNLGASSSELQNVSRILAQTGIGAAKVSKVLEIIAKTDLAPTFQDMATTTEGAIALLGQFGNAARKTARIDVNNLEQALGAVNIVSKRYAVESGDLIAAFRRTGAVAAAAGGDVKELIALFTTARQTTRLGAEKIATGLRTVFARLQRGRTQRFLEGLGISTRDRSGMFVGPFEALKRITDALDTGKIKAGSQTFAELVENIAGIRQYDVVVPLLQNMGLATEVLKTASEGYNSINKDVVTGLQSMQRQLSQVREEFLKLVGAITEDRAFQALFRVVTDLARSFIYLADSLRPIIPLLTVVGGFKLAGLGVGVVRSIKSRGFASGGKVPGVGDRDSVPAVLTPGEFVINKHSAKKIGLGNLHRWNRYAAGGLVTKRRGTYGPGWRNIPGGFEELLPEYMANESHRREIESMAHGVNVRSKSYVNNLLDSNLTNSEIATKLGVSQRTVSKARGGRGAAMGRMERAGSNIVAKRNIRTTTYNRGIRQNIPGGQPTPGRFAKSRSIFGFRSAGYTPPIGQYSIRGERNIPITPSTTGAIQLPRAGGYGEEVADWIGPAQKAGVTGRYVGDWMGGSTYVSTMAGMDSGNLSPATMRMLSGSRGFGRENRLQRLWRKNLPKIQNRMGRVAAYGKYGGRGFASNMGAGILGGGAYLTTLPGVQGALGENLAPALTTGLSTAAIGQSIAANSKGIGKVAGPAGIFAGVILGIAKFEKSVEEQADKIRSVDIAKSIEQLSKNIEDSGRFSGKSLKSLGGTMAVAFRAERAARSAAVGGGIGEVSKVLGTLGEFGGGLYSKMMGRKVEGGAGLSGAVYRTMRKNYGEKRAKSDEIIDKAIVEFDQYVQTAKESGMSFVQFSRTMDETGKPLSEFIKLLKRRNKNIESELKQDFRAWGERRATSSGQIRRGIRMRGGASVMQSFLEMNQPYGTVAEQRGFGGLGMAGTGAFSEAVGRLSLPKIQKQRLNAINLVQQKLPRILAESEFVPGNLQSQFSRNLQGAGIDTSTDVGNALVQQFGKMFSEGGFANLEQALKSPKLFNETIKKLTEVYQNDIEAAQESGKQEEALGQALYERIQKIKEATQNLAQARSNVIMGRSGLGQLRAEFSGQRAPIGLSNTATMAQVSTLTGGVTNVNALGARLQNLRSQFAESPTAALEMQISNTVQALKLLENSTQRASSIREHLNRLEEERKSLIGAKAGFLTSSPIDQRQQLNQLKLAQAVAATNMTGKQFRGLGGQQQAAIVKALQSAQDIRLVGGKMGGDILGELLSPLKGVKKGLGGDINKARGAILGAAEQGVRASEFLSKDAQTVLQEHSTNMNGFVTAVKQLSEQMSKGTIPSEIKISGNHVLEVRLNGASVLENIMPSIKTLMLNEIEYTINDLIKTKFPDAGQYQPQRAKNPNDWVGGGTR